MATLTPNNIAQSIYDLTRERSGKELKKTLENIALFLNRKRLLGKVPLILSSLKTIIHKKEKIIEARVVSAKELSNHDKHTLKHELAQRYKANEVILDEVVDKNVLGGVRIEVADELIDLTVRNKIIRLREKLIK